MEHVHEVHKYLRYLLAETGIERAEWFWFAEAQVYAEPQTWAPLLGKRARLPDDDVHGRTVVSREPWYDVAANESTAGAESWYVEFLNAAKAAGRGNNGVSLTTMLHEQFNRREPTIEPVCALFFRGPPGSSSSGLAKAINFTKSYTKEIPFFKYYPGEFSTTNDAYIKYATTVKDVVRTKDPITGISAHLIYPHDAIVVGLPLFVVEGGGPVLQATMILIAENSYLSSYESQSTRVREIAAACAQFQARASRELAQRYHGVISGFHVGTDPVALLLRPAWSKLENLQQMRMQDFSHDKADIFSIITAEKDENCAAILRAILLFSRVLERTLMQFRINADPTSYESNKLMRAGTYDPAEMQVQQFCGTFGRDNLELAASTALFTWLKILYCHRSELNDCAQRPMTGSDYDVLEEHGEWLKCIILSALNVTRPDGNQIGSPTVSITTGAKIAWQFPVLPGARFLVPWLSMLEEFVCKRAMRANNSKDFAAQANVYLWVGTPPKERMVPEIPECNPAIPHNENMCFAEVQLVGGGWDCPSVATAFADSLTNMKEGARAGHDVGVIWDVATLNLEQAFGRQRLSVYPNGLFRPVPGIEGILKHAINYWCADNGELARTVITFYWELEHKRPETSPKSTERNGL